MASENVTTVVFDLPGINGDAVNARKTKKRKSDSQLVTMALEFRKAAKLEREKRDELNPIVSNKRTLETDIVESLTTIGYRGFTTSDGTRVQLIQRRMDAPDEREIKEGLEAAGFTPEQIRQIKEVRSRTSRVKYDVHVIMRDEQEAQQSGVVSGMVAAIEGAVAT